MHLLKRIVTTFNYFKHVPSANIFNLHGKGHRLTHEMHIPLPLMLSVYSNAMFVQSNTSYTEDF